MSMGSAFWVIMLVWLIFGFVWWSGKIGTYGPLGGSVLLFFLFGLLGWQVFGPPLKG